MLSHGASWVSALVSVCDSSCMRRGRRRRAARRAPRGAAGPGQMTRPRGNRVFKFKSVVSTPPCLPNYHYGAMAAAAEVLLHRLRTLERVVGDTSKLRFDCMEERPFLARRQHLTTFVTIPSQRAAKMPPTRPLAGATLPRRRAPGFRQRLRRGCVHDAGHTTRTRLLALR